jgi:hypothetical protein
MGQPIRVIERPSSRPDVVRFEVNRVLTGMGHEHYSSPEDARRTTRQDWAPDLLARRLFEHPSVESVHVFSNEVTVVLKPGGSPDGLKETIEGLHIHYVPGVQPSII